MSIRGHFWLGWVVLGLLLGGVMGWAKVPATDLVLYGRVYDAGGSQLLGTLAGSIQVKISKRGEETEDPVIASTQALFAATPGGPLEFYVLRIPRFNSGASRTPAQSFVLPGDRLRIFVNGQEVAETKNDAVQFLTTDAIQDLRLLNLNAPVTADSDGDGLPDDWERRYFGGLNQGANDVPPGARVNNFVAYALGLNPTVDNSSKMPFLQIERNGELIYFFRRSSEATGLSYRIVSADELGALLPWATVTGVVPQEVGVEGVSRIMKTVIPEGLDRSRRYFQLEIDR